jgi:hypothetical protein
VEPEAIPSTFPETVDDQNLANFHRKGCTSRICLDFAFNGLYRSGEDIPDRLDNNVLDMRGAKPTDYEVLP